MAIAKKVSNQYGIFTQYGERYSDLQKGCTRCLKGRGIHRYRPVSHAILDREGEGCLVIVLGCGPGLAAQAERHGRVRTED